MNNTYNRVARKDQQQQQQQRSQLQTPLDIPLYPTPQKRQNSLSAYMVSNSNKRTPNPLHTQLGMQSVNSKEYPFNTSTAAIPGSLSQQPQGSLPTGASRFTTNAGCGQGAMATPNVRKGIQSQQINPHKTPTPSPYEIPSSPNVNHLSHLAQQNHSDSSDSNHVLDSGQIHPDSDVKYVPQNVSSREQQQRQQPSPNQQPYQSPSATQKEPSMQPTDSQQMSQQQQQQQQQQQRAMSDEEQQLATKLKETYKNIVNFEEIVQKNCIEITIKINQVTSSSNNPTSLVYGSSSMLNQQISNSLVSNTSSTSRTSELSNDLWTVYHHNITLLDNYYDFLVTSLKPSSNQTQFKTGKNIVELYKIPRRMWVYGIVGFLEVLKNIIGIFQDHEICSCFISYCFNIISNLTDPILEMEGWWSEKLGDLSRMAIALYASKFIDWKISAEYWYSIAMKTLYGHGKIYYHMCTVQQDNLDALVNIGKSVICRDPFVPTQHYLRLVVENICTQRNILSLLELPIIDFIKIHKVLLSIYTTRNETTSGNTNNNNNNGEILDSQVQYGIDLVTRYGLTFGSDSNGYNFFTREMYTPSGTTIDSHQQNLHSQHPYLQHQPLQPHSQLQAQHQPSASNTIEKMNFWFNKGSLFAIANINHLIGFGDAKNPFAKLFELPEALKERKDKKDRKKKSRTSSTTQIEDLNAGGASNGGAGTTTAAAATATATATATANANANANAAASTATTGGGGVDGQSITASDLSVDDWFYCLQFINKSVLELSIRILNHYLVGPKQASTGHVIVWLYFLISVGEATKRYPTSQPMFQWLLRKLFPWESLLNYLNSILAIVKNNPKLCAMYTNYLQLNYLQHFNENEFLPEVWKCWGTLWFDFISEKGDYAFLDEAGVKNNNLFDLPVCGIYPVVNNNMNTLSSGGTSGSDVNFDQKSRNQMENDNDERIIRIILLARTLADEYDFGLVRTSEEFKFDMNIYESKDMVSHDNHNYVYIEEFMLSDGRFVQNNFAQPISMENLTTESNNNMTSSQKDELWFGGFDSHLYDDENIEIGEEIIDDEDEDEDEEIEGYGEGEEEEDDDYQSSRQPNPESTNAFSQYQQQHHHQQQQQQPSRDYYQDSFIGTPTDPMSLGDMIHGSEDGNIEGNFGDKIDTNITYITLDTNIWLKHCGRIFKCVRNGVFKVSIPLIVFQELRALRKSAEATIADAATRSVIIVRELYFAREILPLRFDGTIANDINETTEFENNSNWRSNVDETILNSVYEHDAIGKRLMTGLNLRLAGKPNTQDLYSTTRLARRGSSVGVYDSQSPVVLNSKMAKSFKYCILITDDRNMRLRAKTIGLTSFQSKWLFSQLETVFPHLCID